MEVKIQKINEKAIMPTQGSDKAAGFDLYAVTEKDSEIVWAGETKMIGTGLCMEIPDGYFGAIFARSGLATKQGLRPANCVGIIDSDYRGEIKVALHNDLSSDQFIHDGTRIAQIIFLPYPVITFKEVDSLSETDRGEGGFGSTGIS